MADWSGLGPPSRRLLPQLWASRSDDHRLPADGSGVLPGVQVTALILSISLALGTPLIDGVRAVPLSLPYCDLTWQRVCPGEPAPEREPHQVVRTPPT